MPAIVTEVDSSLPRVIVAGQSPALIHAIASECSELFTPIVCDLTEIKATLDDQVYKLIVVLSPEKEVDENILQQLSKLLITPQIVLPVLSTPADSEPHLHEWNRHAARQADYILKLNEHLPQARFIFCRDVLLETPIKIALGLEKIRSSQLTGRDVKLSIQSRNQVALEIINQIQIPTQQSCIIEGPSTTSEALLQAVLTYHQSEIEIQELEIELHEIETQLSLPFRVRKTIQTQPPTPAAIDQVLYALVQKSLHPPREQLPNPQDPPSRRTQEQELLAQQAQIVDISPSLHSFDPESELVGVITPQRTSHRSTQVQRKAATHTKIVRKSKRKRGLFIFGVLCSVVAGLSMIAFGVYMTTSTVFLNRLQQVTLSLESAPEHFSTPSRIGKFLAEQNNVYAQLVEFDRLFIDQSRLELYEHLFQTTANTLALQKLQDELLVQTLSSEVAPGADQTLTNLTAIAEQTQAVESDLDTLLNLFTTTELQLSSDEALLFEDSQQQLEQEVDQIRTLQTILPIAPEILGLYDAKTYAILLLNDQELRPTGGFIEAVAFVTFKNGHLQYLETLSVYQLDQQLTGAVVPPAEIQQYLGEQRWYLRDANWDPHAPTSMQQVEQFLTSSSGLEIDGVLGVTTLGVADLLSHTGVLQLEQQDQVVSQQTLATQLEQTAEATLSQDEEMQFAQELLHTFLLELQAAPVNVQRLLVAELVELFSQQQTYFTLLSPSPAQKVLAQQRWDGSIITPECPSQLADGVCELDSFYQVEANVGINKVNPYIKRVIFHQVSLEENRAVHSREIEYRNAATTTNWPQGDYATYTRFYVPAQAQHIKVFIDDAPLPVNQVRLSSAHERIVVGAYYSIPVGSTKRVTISYSTPLKPEISSYTFFEQQQFGMSPTPFTLRIALPNERYVTTIAPEGEVDSAQQAVTFTEVIEQNSIFGVQF